MFRNIIYMAAGKAVVAVFATKGLKKAIEYKTNVAKNEKNK